MKRSMLTRILAATVLAALGIGAAQAQSADKYPSRQIRLLVPAPPGGPGDVIARIVGEHMSETWKQPVVVENRPGANNITATDMVAKAAPDGQTLLLTVDYAMTVNPHVFKSLPYDPIKDFAHISTIANAVCVVVAASGTGIQTFDDLVKQSRGRSDGLTVAVGTMTTRLMTERLAELVKGKLSVIPYKGSSESFTAIMGGHVDLSFAGFTPFKPNVSQGRFNVLASTGRARSAATPNVPTLEELGYPGFYTGVWMGLAAPAGTPAAVVQKIGAELNRILALPEVKDQFNRLGLDPLPSTPQTTVELIQQESERWGKIIREKNIRLD